MKRTRGPELTRLLLINRSRYDVKRAWNDRKGNLIPEREIVSSDDRYFKFVGSLARSNGIARHGVRFNNVIWPA